MTTARFHSRRVAASTQAPASPQKLETSRVLEAQRIRLVSTPTRQAVMMRSVETSDRVVTPFALEVVIRMPAREALVVGQHRVVRFDLVPRRRSVMDSMN